MITVILTCYNQEDIIKINLNELSKQKVIPDNILIMNDNWEKNYNKDYFKCDNINVLCYNTKDYNVKGRSSVRNTGIKIAIDLNTSIFIFMDGDTIPKHVLFIKHYIELLNNYELIFGLRQHINRPKDFKNYNDIFLYEPLHIDKMPSDLLTGNFDNLYNRNELNYYDLREISKVFPLFNETTDFNERVDLILSGMITWSCNFAITKDALVKINNFCKDTYNKDIYFDNFVFDNIWGYEDVAFGLDAIFSDVKILLTNKTYIYHFMHNRSDELFNHNAGRHKVMNRYREILFKNFSNKTNI